MAVLTREQCLGADDLTREPVEVPEWGGEVYVRVLPCEDVDAAREKGGGDLDVVGRLLTKAIVNADGIPLFTAEDIAALKQKSHLAWVRLTKAALSLNKLDDGDIEDLEKN